MMFRATLILIAGVIWALASGMYTETIDKRMANLENAVKEIAKTVHDLLTAVRSLKSILLVKGIVICDLQFKIYHACKS